MGRRRLLVIASTYPARSDDGTPAFVRDLALAEAEEFDTVVVVPRVPGSRAREQDGPIRIRRYRYFFSRFEDLAHGAIIENLRQRPVRWLQVVPFFVSQFFAVRRAVRQFRPDVMHVHWIIPQGIIALTVGRRIPVLLTTLGGDLYALNAGPLRFLKSRVVARAARVTVMNAEMGERVRALGAPADTVEVIPMGADVESVRPRVPAEPGHPFRVFFVGRLVEKKGLGHLITALRSLPSGSTTTRVVGDGPLRAELERAAAGLGIEFLGQKGRLDLFDEYTRADVAVFPSVQARSGDRDGLPVALLEAMAAGCAIVASRIPGIDEVVLDGENGLLVEPGDVDGLAAAISRLASDEEFRSRIAGAGAATAARYSVQETGRRYRAILSSLVDGARTARR